MFLFRKKPKLKVNGTISSVDRNGKTHSTETMAVSDRKLNRIVTEQARRRRIEQKYKSVLDKHFALIESIKTEYTVALKKGIDSRAMNKVISLCKEDIALSGKISDYCEKIGDPLYHLPAYERLAIIYEKRGEIGKAIDVCKASIRIGNQTQEFKDRIRKLKSGK